MMFDRRLYRDFDKALIVMVFIAFLFGIVILYSATQSKALRFTESYLLRQMNWMAIGAVFLVITMKISYQRFIDISYLLYGINIILLILVLMLGHVRLGAQRWFSIGAFTFQPSEFMKLNLILALSNYIGARGEAMRSAKNLSISFLLLSAPFLLVLMQPDLGSALILVPISFSMLLVGGASPKQMSILLVSGTASLPLFWKFLHGYQKQRLLVFVNPNVDPLGAGYTIIQSKIAVGSGGLFGKGWLSGTQNQLNFLPERHTDFIFSVVGEEWGLLGALGLVLLYFMIVKRALNIASSTSDVYGKSIATGIAVMIAMQVIINIGMTIGLMPVVGIPMPLISYGGSSLIATFIAVGLLLNVGMRRSTF